MSKSEKGYRQRFEKLVIDFSRQSDRCVELKAKNKKLKDGLIAIRKSTEIMEARRFAEQALEGE